MTDTQLYLAVGLPSFVALVGILVNVGYFVALNSRITSLESRLDSRISSLESRLDNRINSLESRLDARIDKLEHLFDTLLGKVVEIDNRLIRVEDRLKLNP